MLLNPVNIVVDPCVYSGESWLSTAQRPRYNALLNAIHYQWAAAVALARSHIALKIYISEYNFH